MTGNLSGRRFHFRANAPVIGPDHCLCGLVLYVDANGLANPK
ncbi:MAG: hypothetical protein VX107_09010 [Pseudomonadota bacterium]|nr:hypothetical protein [Pseudomonadota bacterium]